MRLRSFLSAHHRYGVFKQPVNEHFKTDENRYDSNKRSTKLTGKRTPLVFTREKSTAENFRGYFDLEVLKHAQRKNTATPSVFQ